MLNCPFPLPALPQAVRKVSQGTVVDVVLDVDEVVVVGG